MLGYGFYISCREAAAHLAHEGFIVKGEEIVQNVRLFQLLLQANLRVFIERAYLSENLPAPTALLIRLTEEYHLEVGELVLDWARFFLKFDLLRAHVLHQSQKLTVYADH